MNSFYYIGHFSKFIRPGAKRIAVASSRAQLLATGFLNTDGSIVVVVMNTSDSEFKYKLYVGNQAAEAKSLPHSIMTLQF
jgi:glucosylceramidase